MVDSTSVLLVFVTVLTAVFVWSRRTYVYWQRRRVKFVQPVHLLGNLKDVLWLQTSFPLLLRDYYFDSQFKDEPVVGIYLFHQPALLIRDLNLVRTILVEDFVSFSMRFSKCDKHVDKLAANSLFFVRNPEWREIRTRLSPAFTSGKIKQMFALMEEVLSLVQPTVFSPAHLAYQSVNLLFLYLLVCIFVSLRHRLAVISRPICSVSLPTAISAATLW